MGEDRRLAALEGAYRSWMGCVTEISEGRFLGPMEGGSPRDRVARLIGWNQLAVVGAKDIMAGKLPGYLKDFTNEYAKVNRELEAHETSNDRAALLERLAATETQAMGFFRGIPAEAWNADFGVRHPDGGPATVRRCVEELTRGYLNATDDVTAGLDSG